MDALHELLTGEHMPKDFYLYMELLKNKMISEKYVPEDSVDTYKEAENWSNYADRIYPIK